MKSTSHKSQQANELNNSIPTNPIFNLIGKFLVWSTIILSACWRLIVQTTRDKCNFNLLSAIGKERLEKRNHQEPEQTKRAKFGTGVKKFVNADIKYPFTVIASLGQFCVNARLMLIQVVFGKWKYLIALMFLTTILQFQPNSIQLAQAQPQVQFPGVTTAFLSRFNPDYTRNMTINEPSGTNETAIYFRFQIPLSAALNFSINYTITQRSGENFLVNGTVTSRSINLATHPSNRVQPPAGMTWLPARHVFEEFKIQGNNVDSDNGIITLTIQDGGSNYSIDSNTANRTAKVNVIDNDGNAPLLTLVGAGTSSSFTESQFSRTTATVTEGNPNTATSPHTNTTTSVYFLMHIPAAATANFIIKYQVTQGQNDNFLVGGTGDRELNLSTNGAVETGINNKKYIRYSFDITNDTVDEPDGVLTLTLKENSSFSGGYSLSNTAANNMATISVMDDDAAPTLTLVGAGGELSIDETKFSRSYSVNEPATGQTKVYFLIHFPTTNMRNFDIKYRVTQGANENFIVGTTTADRTLNPDVQNTMSHGNQASMNKIYTIGSFEIQNDSSNNNGEITLTLKAGTGYILSDTDADNSITIDITGPPIIKLVGAGTTNSFTESDFNNPATIAEGNSGDLTVYFLMYFPANVTSNFMISYSVTEREIRTTNEYVKDDFLKVKTANRTLNLATSGVTSTNSGKRYIKGSFKIKNDTNHEENGQITLTFNAGGNNYDVSETLAERRIVVNVTDNDQGSTPLVTLIGVSSQSGFLFNRFSRTLSISELNFQINFFVSIPASANKNITVEFDFSQRPNDNFISATQLDYYYPRYDLSSATSQFSETLTSQGKSYFRGTVDLVNDDVHEEDGVLTFAIKPGAGYALSSVEAERSATINVMDNDSPSDKPLVTLVGVGGTEDLLDASYGRTNTVEEGDTSTTPVYFLMYIPGDATFPSSIKYQLNQGSNSFLASNFISTSQPPDLTFTTASAPTITRDGRKYIRGSFNIANDTLDEANGDITFTIQDGGSNYAISAVTANRSATITIADNDKPKISITRGSATATEGMDASVSFTLNASILPHQDLTISVFVDEGGDVISSGGKGTRMITMTTADAGTKMDTVSIADDGIDEADSTITIIVSACTGVTVANDCVVETNSTPNDPSNPTKTVSIVVADDEVPKVSISGPASRDDVDGSNNPNTVTFTLEANPIPHQTINIKVNLTQVPKTNGEKLYVGANNSGNQTRTVEMLATDTKTGDTTRGSKTFSVTLQNVNGGDIKATVALNTTEPNKYALAESGITHTTAIVDLNSMPNGPVIEFFNFTTTANVATTSIAEGESFKAKFRAATGNTVSTVLDVNLRVTQSGNFYSGAQSITARITTSGTGETSSIATVEDTEDEADGSITVTLIQGTRTPANKNYQISSDTTKVAKSINVTDNDTPAVSISRTGGSVIEGDTSVKNVPYTIRARPVPYQTITVNLTILQTGNVISGTTAKSITRTIDVSTSGDQIGQFMVANDTVDEANSTVTIQVSTGTGYIPVSNSTDTTKPINKIEFVVEDNDVPQVKIERVTATSTPNDFNYNEGHLRVQYTLTATPVPYQTITISINVSETGDIIKGAKPTTIDMTTSGMKTGEIDLDDDDRYELSSTITVQVNNGMGYAPVSNSTANATTTNKIEVRVADNDIPKISVSSTGSVNENDDAVFTLTSNIRPLEELSIRVDLSAEPLVNTDVLFAGEGTIGEQEGKNTLFITMMPSEFEGKTFDVDLCNATNTTTPCRPDTPTTKRSRGGFITATVNLNPGNDYAPNPAEGASSHRILVIDPDTPNNGPVIELETAPTTPIVEGTAAVFNLRVEAGTILPNNLNVSVLVTQSGDYISGSIPTFVPVTAANGTGSLTIQTNNDSNDEAQGSISVEIVQGLGLLPEGTEQSDEVREVIAMRNYRKSTAPAKVTQTIMVNDNDDPEISITRSGSSFAENVANVTYTLTANPVPHRGIMIKVAITQTGGNMLDPGQTETVSLSASTERVNGTVKILDDNVDEENSTITVQVVTNSNDTGYVPVSNSTANDTTNQTNTITFLVTDDDVPAISVTGNSSVNEADDAVFNLVADPVPWKTITINVEITQTPNVGGQFLYVGLNSLIPQTRTVMMTTSGRAPLTLDLRNQGGGFITATVTTHPDGNYSPKTASDAHTHRIQVIDPDTPPSNNAPVIEIVALTNSTIAEGSSVTFDFQVEAGTAVPTALEVTLSVTQVGTFISGSTPQEVSITTKSDPTATTGGTGSILIQTEDKSGNQANGSITVEIVQGQRYPANKNYRKSLTPSKVSQTVTVEDGDTPVVSIASTSSANLDESGEITYSLRAIPTPYQSITINIGISESVSGNVLAGTQTRQITMMTTGTASGTVNLHNDDVDEDNSTVTIVVDTGTGYTPADKSTANAALGGKITIDVSDNDQPKISVSSASTSLSEGANAVFTLTADINPWEEIVVNVEITQNPNVSGQLIYEGADTSTARRSLTVTMPKSARLTEDFSVRLLNEIAGSDNEMNNVLQGGSITATVKTHPDEKYAPRTASNAHIFEIQVIDPESPPDGPVVTLASVSSNSVTEGTNIIVNFAAGADPIASRSGNPIPSSLTVGLNIVNDDDGDFIKGTAATSVSVPVSGTNSLTIETDNDQNDEADGSITVTIQPGQITPNNANNYQLSNTADERTQTIMVSDNDVPIVSISRTGGAGSVPESGTISYSLSASPAPYQSINIGVTIEQVGAFLDATQTRTISMTSSGSAPGTVTLVDDQLDEADGQVSVTVATGIGYTPAAEDTNPSNKITVNVTDDETPVVSISAGSSNVEEENDAVFTLQADPIPWQDITIVVNVSQNPIVSGDRLYERANASGNLELDVDMLTTSATPGSADINLDLRDVGGGSITVTMQAPANNDKYKLADDTSVPIQVLDLDAPPDGPVIEITRVASTPITEGTNAVFTFSAAQGTTISTELVVNLEVADPGSFIKGPKPTSVNIPIHETNAQTNVRMGGTAELTIPTDDDEVDEANGDITVTIIRGNLHPANKNYQTSSDPLKVTQKITVQDNDEPEVSISRTGGAVDESAGSFTYTLTATPAPYQAITVVVEITESGGDFLADTQTKMITMTPSTTAGADQSSLTETGTVTLETDNVDEVDGTITVSVTTGTGYSPVDNSDPAIKNSIDVSITDDDVPAISIATVNNITSISEVDDINLILTADIDPLVDLTINVDITQLANVLGEVLYVGGHATTGNQTRQVMLLKTDNRTKNFAIDLTDAGGGDITVTVATRVDGNYRPNVTGDAHTRTVRVNDRGSEPDGPIIELIAVSSTTIVEGNTAEFRLQTASGLGVPTALDVDIAYTPTGNFVTESVPASVTIPNGGIMVPLNIDTVDDNNNEPDGSITIAINQGRLQPRNKNYRISADTAKVSQTITVQDNDTPQVSISPVGDSISESDTSVMYTLTALPAPNQDITINLDITVTGDIISGTPSKSITMTTSGTKTETISFVNDDLNEANSIVTIIVTTGTGYVPVSNSTPNDGTNPTNTIEFTVLDDDIPHVSISRVTGTATDTATESDTSISYMLTATPMPYQEITVTVSFRESAGPVLAATQTDKILIPITGSAMGTIILNDDDVDEANSTITIQVVEVANAGYKPVDNTTPNEASSDRITITVSDNDDPRISITTTSSSVSEDDDAVFTLAADIAPWEDITINVSIDASPYNSGETLFIGESSQTVMMSANSQTAEITLDLDDQSGGIITVTVTPHADNKYLPADNGFSRKIQIIDEDANLTGPVIEIVSAAPTIVEGESTVINFQVAAGVQTPLGSELEIDIIIDDPRGLIDGVKPETVTINTDGTGSLPVKTIDNNDASGDGQIGVQILRGRVSPDNKNYNISTDPTKVSQTITVKDNDVPEISIARTGGAIVENITSTTFTLTANPRPSQEITILISISETGNVLATSQSTMITMSSSGTATGGVMIVDDDVNEADSTITIQVVNGAGYQPVSNSTPNTDSSNTITILVSDNDVPELSITAGANVYEQDYPFAIFTITSNVVISGPLAVTYTPVSENYLAAGESGVPVTRNLTFDEVTRKASLRINLDVDNINDPRDTLMVSLVTDGTTPYTVTGGRSATVNVFERPDYVLSIEDSFLYEGNSGTSSMNFNVTLTPPATEDFQLTWRTIIARGDNAVPGADFELIVDEVLTFEVGDTTKRISVEIIGNNLTESNKSFTIAFSKSSQETQIDVSNVRAKGHIINDDTGANEISVFDGSSVTEGEYASFGITSSKDLPASGLRISIHVSQQGQFLAWRTPRTFHMIRSQDTLKVLTVDDGINEEDGTIRVSIISVPAPYRIAEGSESAEVTVKNNDFGTGTPEEQARISIADNVIDEILSLFDPTASSPPPSSEVESSPAMTPPVVSIAAVDNLVDEGTSAKFLIISKNGTESTRISVSFQVTHAHVEIDFPRQVKVQLGGQDSVAVEIPTINNNHADKDGFVAVSLIDDQSYVIEENARRAVVNISDAVDRQKRSAELTAHAQAFIPDLTGTTGANTLATVSNRIELGLSEDSQQTLELWGQDSISNMLKASGEAINENTTSLKSFLGDSSFAMTINSGDEFAIPTTLWGLGDYENISPIGRSRTINWSGDLFTGHIGIDALIQDGLLAGISASVAESEVEFESTSAQFIEFDSRTTALNPYIGWISNDQNSELQATFGMGRGELEIKQESYENEILDSESYSFGLTGNQLLFTTDQIFAGTTRLNIKGDSWFAYRHIAGRDGILADVHTNTHHLRIRTEGTHQFNFATGTTLSPTISIGMRNDVKNHQSVLGFEVTSGADFINPIGITVTGNGSALIGAATQVQKIRLDSSFNYDLGNDQRGIMLEISPSWGQVDASIENTLWESNELDSTFERGRYSNGSSVSGELGYGLELLNDENILTPISGFEITNNQDYEYQLGTRLNLGSNTQFKLTGIRNYAINKHDSTKVLLEGRLSW